MGHVNSNPAVDVGEPGRCSMGPSGVPSLHLRGIFEYSGRILLISLVKTEVKLNLIIFPVEATALNTIRVSARHQKA